MDGVELQINKNKSGSKEFLSPSDLIIKSLDVIHEPIANIHSSTREGMDVEKTTENPQTITLREMREFY